MDIAPCCNGDERSQLDHGKTTLADVEETCRQAAGQLGLEGQLINWLHECGAEVKVGNSIGAGFNPGAQRAHLGALHDAIESASLPLIELHIVHRRQEFRHHSYISPVARGMLGYLLPIDGLYQMSQQER